MRPNEADVNKSDGEFDDRHDAEMITHNVENITLIPNGIHRIEVLFDVAETGPTTTLNDADPYLHRSQWFRMVYGELLQALFCEYSHFSNISPAKLHEKFDITKYFSGKS